MDNLYSQIENNSISISFSLQYFFSLKDEIVAIEITGLTSKQIFKSIF